MRGEKGFLDGKDSATSRASSVAAQIEMACRRGRMGNEQSAVASRLVNGSFGSRFPQSGSDRPRSLIAGLNISDLGHRVFARLKISHLRPPGVWVRLASVKLFARLTCRERDKRGRTREGADQLDISGWVRRSVWSGTASDGGLLSA